MTARRPPAPLNAQIRAEATEWLLRFSEREADAADREEFNDWLRASPEHVRAYLRVSAFWQEADHIEPKGVPRDIGALVARARLEANVFPLDLPYGTGPEASAPRGEQEASTVQPDRARRRRWGRTALALAATLMLAIGLGATMWHFEYRNPTYVTGIGERRTVNLPDGSTVTINASSKLTVRYTDTQRLIKLREGQALFNVAKNPARPFVVDSGDANIRAVGTQFDVYRRSAGTTITVVEGKVAVLPAILAIGRASEARQSGDQENVRSGEEPDDTTEARNPPEASEPHPSSGRRATVYLGAGEQMTMVVPASTDATKVQAVESAVRQADVTSAIAWTTGLLVFENAPLREVVQEFNRQNAKRLSVVGEGLNDLRISGTFPASSSERIVAFLEHRFGVTAEEAEDEVRITKP